jgi:integrase/recombinase XerD
LLSEDLLAGTGCFRSLVEDYLLVARGNYKDPAAVRGNVCRFLTHMVSVEKLASLEEIRPRHVSRFKAAEIERGMKTHNWATIVRTFFFWAEEEERFFGSNPVIPRLHSANDAPRTRDPYEEPEIQYLWNLIEQGGTTQMKLAFSIGLECGLRISEVCNIRLQDVSLAAQAIFVRLPTKNGDTRSVPFHRKTKKYFLQWMAERDVRCEHDHLFHTERLTPAFWMLDGWFHRLFDGKPDPAATFQFHRLRHTWATRLVNNGMELPVLQQLGGWKHLASVQIYAKIRRSTVDREYAAAYERIEKQLAEPQEESFSLFDSALQEGNELLNGSRNCDINPDASATS